MAMKSQTQRSLLLGFITSISLCGVIGIYCLLVGQLSLLAERALGSAATVGLASILALGAAIPWERRRWQPIGPASMLAALAAMITPLSPAA